MWLVAAYYLSEIFHFYSHIPCGMWQLSLMPSQRRESISTHTSRVGCDAKSKTTKIHVINFYSHIPCGMWLSPISFICLSGTFLLTHPVWDVTATAADETTLAQHFYSHIPCGMWLFRGVQMNVVLSFLLTHPVWDVTAIYSIFQSHYSHILQDGPIIHLELY